MHHIINTIQAQTDPVKIVGMAILVIVILVAMVFFLLFLKFFRLWLQARLSRADVKFSELIGMWLRRVDTRVIVLSKITAIQAGLTLTTRDLESHYLAGGRVPREAHSCGAVVAEVTEYHRLDVNSRTGILLQLVYLPVAHRPGDVP